MAAQSHLTLHTSSPPLDINEILASLPEDELRRLRPMLRAMPLAPKQSLQQAGQPLESVYFPWGGVCSLVATMSDGRMAELATVGREGIVGYMAAFGQRVATHDAMLQIPAPGCGAHVMAARDFRALLNRGSGLEAAVHRYANAAHTSLAVSAACNSLHLARERCARWLLIVQDRVGASSFDLSHEYIAMMLGVRRPTATVVAGTLQAAGLIRYRRGHVEILDRPGLEAASCECHALAGQLVREAH